jgi:hypothetical protein
MGKKDIDSLIAACQDGNLKDVRRLVKKGVSLDQRDDKGWTLLQIAAWHGHLDTIQYLVEAGADVNATCGHGATSLHFAAAGGHLDIARYLIESGAEVNLADNDKDTALHYVMAACPSAKILPLFRLLIEHGADPVAVNDDNETALDMAVRYKNREKEKYILEPYKIRDSDFEQILNFFKENYPELVMEWWVRPGR